MAEMLAAASRNQSTGVTTPPQSVDSGTGKPKTS
jgi:hypothetical protein